jgi:hypothetical protein
MSSRTNNVTKRRLNPDAVRHNTRVINLARASLAAFAGIAAGILGLTGLYGFAFYVISSTIMSIIIYLSVTVSSGGQNGGETSSKYSTALAAPLIKYWGNMYGVWTAEVGGNLVSYILFWTFAYGIVHVYD